MATDKEKGEINKKMQLRTFIIKHITWNSIIDKILTHYQTHHKSQSHFTNSIMDQNETLN